MGFWYVFIFMLPNSVILNCKTQVVAKLLLCLRIHSWQGSYLKHSPRHWWQQSLSNWPHSQALVLQTTTYSIADDNLDWVFKWSTQNHNMKIDFDGGEGKKYKSELQKHNDIKIMMEGCYLWFLHHFLIFFSGK